MSMNGWVALESFFFLFWFWSSSPPLRGEVATKKHEEKLRNKKEKKRSEDKKRSEYRRVRHTRVVNIESLPNRIAINEAIESPWVREGLHRSFQRLSILYGWLKW